MEYPGAVLPISSAHQDVPREELRRYFRWFVNNISARVAVLEAAVRSTPGFEAWRADDTRKSFELLGVWFASRIEVRRKTAEELIDERRRMGKFWHPDQPHSDVVVTDQVMCIAHDIGMYFGRSLGTQLELPWSQDWAPTSVSYGDPILRGRRSRMSLSPAHILAVHAQKLAKGTDDARRLASLFDIWRDSLA
jgi:hypothetical protein